MNQKYIEKIYAGWLAKIIGIRLGAPVEGWSHEKIQSLYGDIDGYLLNYTNFHPDDDSNGPMFFLRALEDKINDEMTSMDVANALLNYVPYEHGFFWWGGYGISTEHTAYLNLMNNIKPPQSGSASQNGKVISEQIGGQIFIDTWGLVTPGNPDLASKLAKEAASVTHDINGIYGGIFIATCISYAFEESNIKSIINKGLSYLPKDSDYYNMVIDVMNFYESDKDNWTNCFKYIKDKYFNYKYPGMCHIIPNSAIIILSLLYGNGDFDETIQICNRCGFDTDCNVGNVATIVGVINGLDKIDYNKWRKDINDVLICSSVIGSLNIMDIPYGASYIIKLASKLSNMEIPYPYDEIINNKINSAHFEYKGSTHGIRTRVDSPGANYEINKQTTLINTDETKNTGNRSLKLVTKGILPGENIYLYQKTYYNPNDFNVKMYDPEFSPTVYPGQTINVSAYIPNYSEEARVCIYAKDSRANKIYKSEQTHLTKDKWINLKYDIPKLSGALIDEVGVCFQILGTNFRPIDFVGFIDDLYISGNANYEIDFKNETGQMWTINHKTITQFTRLKGLMYMEDNHMHISCSDFGECYTGGYDFNNYNAKFTFTPIHGYNHLVNVRVQGAMRSYAVGLLPNNKLAILKKNKEYQILKEVDFNWGLNKEYEISISVENNKIEAKIDDKHVDFIDENNPYTYGCIGIGVREGSHSKFRSIVITPN